MAAPIGVVRDSSLKVFRLLVAEGSGTKEVVQHGIPQERSSRPVAKSLLERPYGWNSFAVGGVENRQPRLLWLDAYQGPVR